MVSVIIPSRNEKYLEPTIRNVLENAEGEIEVIAILDGWDYDPEIKIDDDRVIFITHKENIGQRHSINEAARMAKGKYIMKLDAHCAVDKGFDIKLVVDCEYNWTVIPRMYNLDISNFTPKLHKRTDYMYISSMKADKPFRARYYGSKQPKNDIMIDDTMCCMGPCFFMHKERFWELGGCDEGHGGWGQQGVEVSCKAWLSGGALKVNKNTWFAHWFRGGSYDEVYSPGFPYKASGRAQQFARKYSQDLWLNNKWDKQIREFQWMLDKFDPPGWTDDMTLLFYTSNTVKKTIMNPVIRSLKKHGYPIVSVSQEPMDLGKNFVVQKEKSLHNIYRQVLRAAKEADTEFVALCEDDCFYTKDHFKHRPKHHFSYNLNRWLLHLDEEIYSYRKRPILSQCIARRKSLIANLEERFKLDKIPDKYCGEMGVFDKKLGMTEYGYETFETKDPNLVVCHRDNTLRARKLLGQDAEPTKNLEPWGDVNYWVNKLTEIPKGKLSLRNQVSYMSGKRYKIQDILDNLEWFWDYRKMDRMPEYKNVLEFYKKINSKKTFTDEELKKQPYFNYLLSIRNKKNSNAEARCLEIMKSGVALYHDIKENGMMNPLELWRDKKRDKMNIHRGLKRLAVKNALGHKYVATRVYKSREALEKLQTPPNDNVDQNSIHGIAVDQFRKYEYNGTDKYWTHKYTPIYDLYLKDKKYKKVLELGVKNGASILLWHDFFPEAQIYGFDKDISKAKMVEGLDRVTLIEGMQGSDDEKKIIEHGKFDFIVDDCTHVPAHQKQTLELLWDSLESGGIYVVEDMHWRGSETKTAMDKLKDMVDKIDKLEITAIHFHYNICFLEKR